MRIAALVTLTLATLVSGVTAQEPYPTRAISIVNPFPPGGIADLTGRPPAATFERLLKQPVVVNKAGAAGAVGAQFASVAKPDGYILLIALVSISSTPEVDKLFGRPATYTLDQFVGIARLNADPPILAVNGPWKTLKELVIVGNPLETALAISKLIFGGVLERLPDLRIAFAHGGGAFPFTLARLNHGWHARPEGPAAIPEEPREYARRIYVDSLTLSPRNLRFIVDELGADRVMIGSDYPFDMGDTDPLRSLDAARLDPGTRSLIAGQTAARFLRLEAA